MRQTLPFSPNPDLSPKCYQVIEKRPNVRHLAEFKSVNALIEHFAENLKRVNPTIKQKAIQILQDYIFNNPLPSRIYRIRSLALAYHVSKSNPPLLHKIFEEMRGYRINGHNELLFYKSLCNARVKKPTDIFDYVYPGNLAELVDDHRYKLIADIAKASPWPERVWAIAYKMILVAFDMSDSRASDSDEHDKEITDFLQKQFYPRYTPIGLLESIVTTLQIATTRLLQIANVIPNDNDSESEKLLIMYYLRRFVQGQVKVVFIIKTNGEMDVVLFNEESLPPLFQRLIAEQFVKSSKKVDRELALLRSTNTEIMLKLLKEHIEQTPPSLNDLLYLLNFKNLAPPQLFEIIACYLKNVSELEKSDKQVLLKFLINCDDVGLWSNLLKSFPCSGLTAIAEELFITNGKKTLLNTLTHLGIFQKTNTFSYNKILGWTRYVVQLTAVPEIISVPQEEADEELDEESREDSSARRLSPHDVAESKQIDSAFLQSYQTLQRAVKKRDVAKVQLIVKQYPKLAFYCFNQEPPLMSVAAKNGDLPMVKLFCQNAGPADLALGDSEGFTPIFGAVETRKIQIIEFLLTRMTIEQLNVRNKKGFSVLASAIIWGYFDVVKLLMEHILTDSNREALDTLDPPFFSLPDEETQVYVQGGILEVAFHCKQDQIIHYLITKCPTLLADFIQTTEDFINNFKYALKEGLEDTARLLIMLKPELMDFRDKNYGGCALLFAAHFGRESVVHLLMEKYPMQLDEVDCYGRTPLSAAFGEGHHKIANLLLRKANLKQLLMADIKKRILLHSAVSKSNIDFVLFSLAIFKKQECPFEQWFTADVWGYTPLHEAAEQANPKIVTHLFGAIPPKLLTSAILAGNEEGNSSLHLAAKSSNPAITKVFMDSLDQGQRNLPNVDGMTPFHLAVQFEQVENIKLFLSTLDREQVNTCGESGSALQLAMMMKNFKSVEALLQSDKIDINSLHEGITVLHYVVQQKNSAMVKALIARSDLNLLLPDAEGYTPLDRATQLGYQEIIDLLKPATEAYRKKDSAPSQPVLSPSPATKPSVPRDEKQTKFSFLTAWAKSCERAESIYQATKKKSLTRQQRYALEEFSSDSFSRKTDQKESPKPEQKASYIPSKVNFYQNPSPSPANQDCYFLIKDFEAESKKSKSGKKTSKTMYGCISHTIIDKLGQDNWQRLSKFLQRADETSFVGQKRKVAGAKKLVGRGGWEVTTRQEDIGDHLITTEETDFIRTEPAPWNSEKNISVMHFTRLESHVSLKKGFK